MIQNHHQIHNGKTLIDICGTALTDHSNLPLDTENSQFINIDGNGN